MKTLKSSPVVLTVSKVLKLPSEPVFTVHLFEGVAQGGGAVSQRAATKQAKNSLVASVLPRQYHWEV